MTRVIEWIKGISVFLVLTFIFWYFWGNIFSNIIEYVAYDFLSIGANATTSYQILKTFAWVSYGLLYITICPLYLVYTGFVGAKNDIKTDPKYFMLAIGVWIPVMLFSNLIYMIIYLLDNTMTTTLSQNVTITSIGGTTTTHALLEASSVASTFSWLCVLLALIGMVFVPFYYVLRGYGIELGEKGVTR